MNDVVFIFLQKETVFSCTGTKCSVMHQRFQRNSPITGTCFKHKNKIKFSFSTRRAFMVGCFRFQSEGDTGVEKGKRSEFVTILRTGKTGLFF